MGISLSLILAAAGAVLLWAVNADTSGVDLDTVGLILLVVGIVGMLLSFAFWSSWGGFGSRADMVVDDGPAPTRRVVRRAPAERTVERETIVEDDVV